MSLCGHESAFLLELLGHIVVVCLMLQERAKLLSKVAMLFCIPPTMYEKSICFTHLPEHGIIGHFHFIHSSGYVGVSHYILICTFLLTYDDEGLYLFLLTFGISLVVSIQMFLLVQNWVMFLMLSSRILYILWIKIL